MTPFGEVGVLLQLWPSDVGVDTLTSRRMAQQSLPLTEGYSVMRTTEAFPIPFRLGYFLESRSAKCFDRRIPKYRGVDRLRFWPDFESVRHDELRNLWAEVWKAHESRNLNTNPDHALSFAQSLEPYGVELDVVYVEICFVPGRDTNLLPESFRTGMATWLQIHEVIERPRSAEFLGYDVSLPFPSFHSAICQPGLSQANSEVGLRLNSVGLFDTVDAALPYVDEANCLEYAAFPFCLLGVWAI
jgi:hypothetical protein